MQAHIIYKGRVQGIGFRFTVERVALNLGVVGWVKNLANGNVEVVAEAEEETIKNFLGIVRGYFLRYIVDEEIGTTEAIGNFSDFLVRF
ncbi:MAG: acylphosphatase [Candidatus Omnitrophica bacterium]|nr:acylphosphatase [Candidatus Omnitrophota bacterium]